MLILLLSKSNIKNDSNCYRFLLIIIRPRINNSKIRSIFKEKSKKYNNIIPNNFDLKINDITNLCIVFVIFPEHTVFYRPHIHNAII